MKAFINNLITYTDNFFNEFSIVSINFLTWTSPVVAALLALTTIVFSQYNEKLLNTSNILNRDIKTGINKKNQNDVIISKINEMIFTLRGKLLYTINIYFFTLISFLSFLAWLMSGIGYIYLNDHIFLADKIIIMLGLAVITLTFLILPVILILFSRKPVLTLDFFNRLTFENFSFYLNQLSIISNEEVISNLISPKFNFTLSNERKVKIEFFQEIPITDTHFIIEFNGRNFEKEYIKLINKTTDNSLVFHLKSLNLEENNYTSLFEKIDKSLTQNLYVFSNKKNILLASFELEKIIVNDGYNFSLEISENHRLSNNEQIQSLLNSKAGFLYIENGNENFYNLEKMQSQ